MKRQLKIRRKPSKPKTKLTERFSGRMKPVLRARLTYYCDKEKRDESEVLRLALEDYLNRRRVPKGVAA